MTHLDDSAEGDWSAAVRIVLGHQRVDALVDLRHPVEELRQFTDSAETTIINLGTLDQRGWDLLRATSRRGETWAFANSVSENDTRWAVDEVSPAGERDVAGALTYPELHMRLVAWYLVHAWRFTDLADDTYDNLRQWRLTSAAVTARALLEEVGCLLTEGREAAAAWATAKSTSSPENGRASAVRMAMRPVMDRFDFDTRSKIREPARLQEARNVLGYVQRLARTTGVRAVENWYDWLTDAAHPALGARIAMTTLPDVHLSGAVTVRRLARRPISTAREGSNSAHQTYPIACAAADAATLCMEIGHVVLGQMLAVVDDFGLSTGAAALTRRLYWRNLAPTRGSRACPCGKGAWRDCDHRWGAPAPEINVPLLKGPEAFSP